MKYHPKLEISSEGKKKTRSNCPMGKLELLQLDEFALNRAQTVNEENQTHFVLSFIFSRWLTFYAYKCEWHQIGC